MIALCEWNKASIRKMLWDLNAKKDKIWITWIHHYYMKGADCNTYQPPNYALCILKAIFKDKVAMMNSVARLDFLNKGWYSTRDVYNMLRGDKPKVSWRRLILGNLARPRAIFVVWMASLRRLPTKDRLNRFGIQTDGVCVYYGKQENFQHLSFECEFVKHI
ncbi:unnamed protein product [Vicia faba]|uniref:Reverse transcriptase zinc-binding domain-containing protein n=1 Tax=Vicia faba TaxID=3906 RepID=A0AAV0YY47_VICFA|nr:unnamed protein product [Vicia faba]